MKFLHLATFAVIFGALCLVTGCASDPEPEEDDVLVNDIVFDDMGPSGVEEDIIVDDYMNPDAEALPAEDVEFPTDATMVEEAYAPAGRPMARPGSYAQPAVYNVPPSKTYPDSGGSRTASVSAPRGTASSGSYTVQPGDSLWAISRTYGCTVTALANANSINPQDTLKVGTVLRIPSGSSSASSGSSTFSPPAGGQAYTVQRGDSWYSIGKKFGVNYKELMSYNGATSSMLREGQDVKIP